MKQLLAWKSQDKVRSDSHQLADALRKIRGAATNQTVSDAEKVAYIQGVLSMVRGVVDAR